MTRETIIYNALRQRMNFNASSVPRVSCRIAIVAVISFTVSAILSLRTLPLDTVRSLKLLAISQAVAIGFVNHSSLHVDQQFRLDSILLAILLCCITIPLIASSLFRFRRKIFDGTGKSSESMFDMKMMAMLLGVLCSSDQYEKFGTSCILMEG
jgi:hypothetical protein